MSTTTTTWMVGREHTHTVNDDETEHIRTWTVLRLQKGPTSMAMSFSPAETRKLIAALYSSLDKDEPPSDG